MAPHETTKPKSPSRTPRTIKKNNTNKQNLTTAMKEKSILSKPVIIKTPRKELKDTTNIQPKPFIVPTTPRPKKPNVDKATSHSCTKPSWMRRPRPAHSGVPVPEKMRKLIDRRLRESKMEAANSSSANQTM